jgi:hypothetical protein
MEEIYDVFDNTRENTKLHSDKVSKYVKLKI